MVGESDTRPRRKVRPWSYGLRRRPQVPMMEAADVRQRHYAARRKRPGFDFADVWSVDIPAEVGDCADDEADHDVILIR